MLHCWHGEQFLWQNIRAFLSLEIQDPQAINHVIFVVFTIVFSCLLKKLIMYKKITRFDRWLYKCSFVPFVPQHNALIDYNLRLVQRKASAPRTQNHPEIVEAGAKFIHKQTLKITFHNWFSILSLICLPLLI